jgi:putative transcriptional regulator
MIKKKNSSVSREPSKSVDKEGTKFGRDLIAGAKQILAHVQKRKMMDEYTLPAPIDVKGIRAKVGMSQAQFADAFCLNRRTLQQWEQGKASPDLAVRAYLTVIERNPDVVKAALRQ